MTAPRDGSLALDPVMMPHLHRRGDKTDTVSGLDQ